ncbi:cysteine desulfurase [bacterium]|nr:cysteine desulfurase [bacterium]
MEQGGVAGIRNQFPVLGRQVNDHPLVYLDSGATTQKPRRVIDRMTQCLTRDYATVHRGVYSMSQESTEACERVRHLVASFVNARSVNEVVFTSGTTESLNLIATILGRGYLKSGDEILITQMEHHANIVPWQEVAKSVGARLKVAPIDSSGDIRLDEFNSLVTDTTKVVAFTHVSNVLGTVNPVEDLVRIAKNVGAIVVVDGAQGIAHRPVDVRKMGCDFYCFSAHKAYGPTGVGVLVGRYDLLTQLPPYKFGGDMIETVTFDGSTYALPPAKFEAGTPPIVEIIGLGEAIQFLIDVGWHALLAHEHQLISYLMNQLSTIPGIQLIGTPREKSAAVSFVMSGVHPHDVGTILDQEGVAVRVGHHCAQPLMGVYNVPATIRASLGVYNNYQDIDRLIEALLTVRKYFS